METKEEILDFKQKYLELYKERLISLKNNANYRKLIREKLYYPPEMLYQEAKYIIDGINEGKIVNNSIALDLALVSLDAIQESKIKEAKTLKKRK